MDCKELIEKLRGPGARRYVLEAAHTLETLLAEREALIKLHEEQCGMRINPEILEESE